MAIGKESIKRAASVNNSATKEVKEVQKLKEVQEVKEVKEVKEAQEAIKTTKTNKKPTVKRSTTKTAAIKTENTTEKLEEKPEDKPVLEKRKEVVSKIKSDLPIYLL